MIVILLYRHRQDPNWESVQTTLRKHHEVMSTAFNIKSVLLTGGACGGGSPARGKIPGVMLTAGQGITSEGSLCPNPPNSQTEKYLNNLPLHDVADQDVIPNTLTVCVNT